MDSPPSATDHSPQPVARDSQPVARNFSSAKCTASDHLFQFTTITAGVWIVLLVHGVVELCDTRARVAQARDTIARTIADNRNDLDKTMANCPKREMMVTFDSPVVHYEIVGAKPR